MKSTIGCLAFVLCSLAALPIGAQERSLDLTVNDVGISIGDSRRVTGLRINFRDRNLEEVNGANITVWTPYAYSGVVRGLALGLPATGADRIEGIGLGIVGVAAGQHLRGLAIGGLGIGAGSDVRGIAIGGLGVGAGSDIRGITITGIGAGAGGDLRGLSVAGIGVGVGGNAQGVIVSGIGAGVGGDLLGMSVAGVGFGVGGRMRGLTIAGIGFGAGGDVSGIQIAGLGMGVGGTLRPVSVAGIGIGASSIEGLAIASAMGTERARGVMIAPAYFKVTRNGSVNGVNVSAFNHVQGTQRGLALGIFNYARSLEGLQIGILNYAANKSPGTRLLPVANYARSRTPREAQ